MIERELTEKVLPFWKSLKDARGGFFGACTFKGKIKKNAIKGVIYHSRILWFFCNCYLYSKDEELLEYIEHCYKFIVDKCIDYKNMGAYWSVDCNGRVKDAGKHTYNNAFLLFGLCQYYKVTKNENTLKLAMSIYDKIESIKAAEGYYFEQFDSGYKVVPNKKLTTVGKPAVSTMNTVLHIMEAYTDLYEVSGDKDVRQALERILNFFHDKIYDPQLKRLEVFFDENMKSIANIHSFGHDIEAAWLIDRAIDNLNESMPQLRIMTQELSKAVYETGFDKNCVINESIDGKIDDDRIWWVQAEAVLGFFNAFERTKQQHYANAAEKISSYILEQISLQREWCWLRTAKGRLSKRNLAEMWKCPYHNGRMLLEILKHKKV